MLTLSLVGGVLLATVAAVVLVNAFRVPSLLDAVVGSLLAMGAFALLDMAGVVPA